MATVEHDFSDHDQMATPKPADNIGAAGFGDMMGDAVEFAIEADRRGDLLKCCHAYMVDTVAKWPRAYWVDELRELVEAIEAELGMSVEVKP